MSSNYILAAINRRQLEGALRITEAHKRVVIGTMDGGVLRKAAAGRPAGGVDVYFYEPG